MTAHSVARRSPGFSRRASLAAPGSAGLIAMADSSIVAAGKSRKKANRKAKKQGKKKCKKQVGQCSEFIEDLCSSAQGPGRELCEARLTPCCDFLAQCQATSFFVCIFENAESAAGTRLANEHLPLRNGGTRE